MSASSIFFNGRVTSIPGSYSEVDASGLAVVGLSASGIVACIGEAEGGEPGVVIGITNPGKIGRTFRAGDLKEAGNMLFDPSRDPDIAGGAQEIKFVKVNPATQSSRTLVNGDGDVLTVTSIDYGLFTTQINLEIADGTTQGKSITIRRGSTTEVFDDVGGDPAFTALYTPGSNGATTMLMTLDNTVQGVTVTCTVARTGLAADYVGRTDAITGLDSHKLANIGAGNVAQVHSTSAGDTTQTVTVFGVVNGSGLPGTETIALNGTTPVAGVTVWASLHGFVLSATAVGTVTVEDGTTNTDLYQATAGQTSRGVYTFGGQTIESALAALSIVASGATTQQMIVVGTNHAAAATAELVTLTGATPVVTTTDWARVDYLAIGYVEAARTITASGLLLNQTDTVSVVSSNAADTTQTVTVYGTSITNTAQTEVIALNGTTPVSGVATWNKVLGIELSAAAAGSVSVVSSSASLDLFILSAADLYGGFYPLDNVTISGSAVTVSDSGATRNRSLLLVGLDANGDAQAVVLTATGALLSPVETWSELTGIAMGHVQGSRTLTLNATAFNLPIATFATVNDVADRINSRSGWVVTVGVNAGDIEIGDMDNHAAESVLTPAKSFTADTAFIIAKINAESQLVSAAVATGFTGPPSNTTSPVFLTGGAEGTTLFSHWQAALDALRDEFVNTIVVLTDDDAVHAAVAAHCVYMAGPGRRERDAVLGAASGETLALVKARAEDLNTRHCRLAFQDAERFNTDGVREQFPPYFTACLAAGMQAGADVGTPLTAKFPNLLDVIGNDTSYTVQDDANDMINSGLLALEKVPGVGFRWLRNITTYLIDANLAYTEASVNQAVNFAIYNLRTELEIAVGKKAFAGTLNAGLGVAIDILNQLMDQEVIVLWRNIVIEIDADVMTVDVEVAPVLPINFVKTTLHLTTASFSASA